MIREFIFMITGGELLFKFVRHLYLSWYHIYNNTLLMGLDNIVNGLHSKGHSLNILGSNRIMTTKGQLRSENGRLLPVLKIQRFKFNQDIL